MAREIMIPEDRLSQMAAALKQNQPHQAFIPDILQPTASFLDHANRDVRRHFCILTDVEGRSFFLRPDFTLPICLHYAAEQNDAPMRFFYHGDIWLWERASGRRLRRSQMGIEHIGRQDQAQAAADVIAAIYQALMISGAAAPILKMGDPGLFDRLIDQLDLPDGWQARLKKRFRLDAGLSSFLKQAQQTMRPRNKNYADIQSEDALKAFLKKNNIPHIGQRRLGEICERLREQNALYMPDLPAQTMQIIQGFLNLSGDSPERTLDHIRDFAARHRLSLDDEIAEITNRFDAMKKTPLAEIFTRAEARLSTHFQGSHLNYYTGFIFAFLSPLKNDLPLAGGGHYNGLIRELGVANGTGVGATIYLDEL